MGDLLVRILNVREELLEDVCDVRILDDAAGIGHAFQVIDHIVTNTDTNPYDIHEILAFHQDMEPPYRLLA